MGIWDLNLLEPSGPHRACYGTALPYIYIYIHIYIVIYLFAKVLKKHNGSVVRVKVPKPGALISILILFCQQILGLPSGLSPK